MVSPAEAEAEIFANGEGGDERQRRRVVGNAGDAARADFRHRPAARVLAPQGLHAAARADEPEDEVSEFALSVAGHARDAEDFAAADLQRDPAQGDGAVARLSIDALEPQRRFAMRF